MLVHRSGYVGFFVDAKMNGVDRDVQQQHAASSSGRRGNAAVVAAASVAEREQTTSQQDREQKSANTGKWTHKMYARSTKRYGKPGKQCRKAVQERYICFFRSGRFEADARAIDV